jgi:hypothetical protein
MVRFIAKIIAKWKYVYEQEVQAATAEINASLAGKTAFEKKKLVEQLTKEADDISKRITDMAAMEEKGFWTCENGHEQADAPAFFEGREVTLPKCDICGKPLTLIKRELMSGQQQYESDKERKEAEKVAADKLQQATAEQENVEGSEKTTQYFRSQAAMNRALADKIRNL